MVPTDGGTHSPSQAGSNGRCGMNDHEPAESRREHGQKLSTEDLANLANCFITPDIAAQADLFRVGDVEGAHLVGRTPNASSSYSGYVFTYKLPGDSSRREY